MLDHQRSKHAVIVLSTLVPVIILAEECHLLQMWNMPENFRSNDLSAPESVMAPVDRALVTVLKILEPRKD